MNSESIIRDDKGMSEMSVNEFIPIMIRSRANLKT